MNELERIETIEVPARRTERSAQGAARGRRAGEALESVAARRSPERAVKAVASSRSEGGSPPQAGGNRHSLPYPPDPRIGSTAATAWTDYARNPPTGTADRRPRADADPSLLLGPPEVPVQAGRAAAAWAGKTGNRPIEMAIIQRYLRRQGSMEEALLEIHHAGVSLWRAEATAKALWGAHVTAATVCDRYQRLASRIEAWRRQPIRGRHAYVYLGAVELERGGEGGDAKVSVLAAVGINERGSRDVLGVFAGANRKGRTWQTFLHQLKKRGLSGVRLFISEPGEGIAEGIHGAYPGALHQICAWRFQHDLLLQVPIAQLAVVGQRLNAIYASASRDGARAQARKAALQLRQMGLPQVALVLRRSVGPTTRFFAFPRDHWRSLRSSSPLVRIMRQIGARARRLRVVVDEVSAGLIVSAGLRCVADQWTASRNRLDMRRLGGGVNARSQVGNV